MTDVITASVSFPRQPVTGHGDSSLDRCPVTSVSWPKSKPDQNRIPGLAKDLSSPQNEQICSAIKPFFISQCESISFELTLGSGRAEKEKRLLPAPDPMWSLNRKWGLRLIPVSHPPVDSTEALTELRGGRRLLMMMINQKKILEAFKTEAVTWYFSKASARKISDLVVLLSTSYFLLI